MAEVQTGAACRALALDREGPDRQRQAVLDVLRASDLYYYSLEPLGHCLLDMGEALGHNVADMDVARIGNVPGNRDGHWEQDAATSHQYRHDIHCCAGFAC